MIHINSAFLFVCLLILIERYEDPVSYFQYELVPHLYPTDTLWCIYGSLWTSNLTPTDRKKGNSIDFPLPLSKCVFFFFFFFWEACELNRQQCVNAMKILRSINQLLKERCQGHCLWWVPHEEPRGTVLHEDHQESIHNYPYQILRDVAFVGCHFFKLDKHWLIRQIDRYLVSVFDGYCTVMVINWSRLQLMQPFCWLEAR